MTDKMSGKQKSHKFRYKLSALFYSIDFFSSLEFIEQVAGFNYGVGEQEAKNKGTIAINKGMKKPFH